MMILIMIMSQDRHHGQNDWKFENEAIFYGLSCSCCPLLESDNFSAGVWLMIFLLRSYNILSNYLTFRKRPTCFSTPCCCNCLVDGEWNWQLHLDTYLFWKISYLCSWGNKRCVKQKRSLRSDSKQRVDLSHLKSDFTSFNVCLFIEFPRSIVILCTSCRKPSITQKNHLQIIPWELKKDKRPPSYYSTLLAYEWSWRFLSNGILKKRLSSGQILWKFGKKKAIEAWNFSALLTFQICCWKSSTDVY